MAEGTTRPIPIRRSRQGARPDRSGPFLTTLARWSDGLLTSAQTVLEPPRQLWLAGLGGSSLGISGARATWARLVAEGADTERWLRDRLDEVVSAVRGSRSLSSR